MAPARPTPRAGGASPPPAASPTRQAKPCRAATRRGHPSESAAWGARPARRSPAHRRSVTRPAALLSVAIHQHRPQPRSSRLCCRFYCPVAVFQLTEARLRVNNATAVALMGLRRRAGGAGGRRAEPGGDGAGRDPGAGAHVPEDQRCGRGGRLRRAEHRLRAGPHAT